MPSWAARTASSSSSTSTTAAREHAQDAHVPNGTLSRTTDNDKGKQKMAMSYSQIAASAQAPSIAGTMAMSNGKSVTNTKYKPGGSNMQQTIAEDEDQAGSSSSTSEVSPEDAEALLWDAQVRRCLLYT